MKWNIPKNAKILTAKDEFVTIDGEEYDGLKIETDKGNIVLGINPYQQCCEDFGSYLSTPDDLDDIIGGKILSVCTLAGDTKLEISTTKGDIQYSVYNEHNGYYSHGVILVVFDDIELDYI